MTTGPPKRQPEVIVGVDAHKHTHHAVIITSTGQRLIDSEFPATSLDTQTCCPGPPSTATFKSSEWNPPAPTLPDSPDSDRSSRGGTRSEHSARAYQSQSW